MDILGLFWEYPPPNLPYEFLKDQKLFMESQFLNVLLKRGGTKRS